MGVRGKFIGFLAAPEGVEEVELTEPWQTLSEEGGICRLISTEHGEIQAFNHLDRGQRFPVDFTVDETANQDLAGLVLPGGVANPDYLRTVPDAVEFVGRIFTSGVPVAAICHGAWTVIEAGQARGRVLTSWPSLKTDIRNAGGTWVDEELVRCDHGPNVMITSRGPKDLPAFCAAALELFGA